MTSWTDLSAELAAWSEAGRAPVFWWRDDDAAAGGAPLERLLALAEGAGVPLALAVIPAKIEPSLVDALEGRETIALLQHGHAHTNHAPAGEKKAEYGNHRPYKVMGTELAVGRAAGRKRFGERWRPVLVPPWNRIDAAFAETLAGLGFAGLSTHGEAPRAPKGLVQVNTHIDIMRWRPRRAFLGEAAVLEALCAELCKRREDGSAEPVGLLTHHLVHDQESWGFLETLIPRLNDGTAEWPKVERLFGLEA